MTQIYDNTNTSLAVFAVGSPDKVICPGFLFKDNLNTHNKSSLYEAFEPAEAIEIHYTPKHGSWLDMAEIELGILSRQCLTRRIESMEKLKKEVNSWQMIRNTAEAKVNWRFTTEDARIKLKKLYPSIEM